MPSLEDFTEPIWEQQAGEPDLWFGRFCRYRNMIGSRSVLAAWFDEQGQRANEGDRRAIEALKRASKRKKKQCPGSWNEASADWHWKARAIARDRFVQEEEDRIWVSRQKAFRDQRWRWYETLNSKAEPMMRMPIVSQVIERSDAEGSMTTRITATEWSQFRHAIALIELADRLGAGAIGDLNEALNLLIAKGFEVSDPTANLQADDYQALSAAPDNALEPVWTDPQSNQENC